MCFKIIFEYLGCLYIIRNLQNENFRYQSIEMERAPDCEAFELSRAGPSPFNNPNFGRYIDSIKVFIDYDYIQDHKFVMVKADEKNSEFSLAKEVKDVLCNQKCSFLKFEITLPSEEYESPNDQPKLKQTFEEFFDQKVRHKFY